MPILALLRHRAHFVLPPSQRVYGWGEEHLNRILTDCFASAANETGWLFLGTIYLATLPDGTSSIADGQQRVVTITMLVAAARDLEADPDRRALLDDMIHIDSEPRLRLRDVDGAFFLRWVQTPGATLETYRGDEDSDDAEDDGSMGAAPRSESQRNMLANRNLLVEKLKALTPDMRWQLIEFLARGSEVVLIEAPSLPDALGAYASTHKRGLRLAETDRLKLEIIGDAEPSLRGDLANRWDESEARAGKAGLEELFELLLQNETGRNAPADLLTEVLTRFDLPTNAAEFIRTRLVPASIAYGHLLNAGKDLPQPGATSIRERVRHRAIQGHLTTLLRVTHTEWRGPAMVAIANLKDGDGYRDLRRTLGALERLSAAFMIAGEQPVEICQRYAAAAKALINGDTAALDAALDVSDDLKRRVHEQLASPNFATKSRFRMPVLMKLNDILSKTVVALDPKSVSCEHVLPQNVVRNGKGWHVLYRTPNGRRYTGNNFRHRLGNVSILSHQDNSDAADHEFAVKRSILARSTFAISQAAARETEWTVATVEQRSAALTKLLADHWKL